MDKAQRVFGNALEANQNARRTLSYWRTGRCKRFVFSPGMTSPYQYYCLLSSLSSKMRPVGLVRYYRV